jgi:lipoprotein-anchoring transpeptidase ErfK/SrfK
MKHAALMVVFFFSLAFAVSIGAGAEAATREFSPKDGEMWVKIDKNKLRIYLCKGSGEVLKNYPIAIGKGKGNKKTRTDLITPAGVFKIWRVVEDATELVYDPKWFGEPGEPQKGAYGAKLISFYNPWQIAIHGTNAPRSIGQRVTHGCVRLYNKDIVELTKYIKPGMRLWIVEKDVIRDTI